MRRNLTISFDDGFIEWLDDQRGKTSRGAYLEAACPKARHIETIPQTWDAPAKDERSPEPQVEDLQRGEAAHAAVKRDVAERLGLVKPSLPRPIIQKRGT